MPVQVANNAFSTLASSITAVATSLSVQAGQGARFPAASVGTSQWFYATLIDTSNNLEIVKVTARATDTFTIIRAQGGTTARAYSSGSRIELRPVAELFQDIRDNQAFNNIAVTGGTVTGLTNLGVADATAAGLARTSLDVDRLGVFAALNAQTLTAYTLTLTDRGKVIEMNNAAANTVTVPPNSSVAFPIGTQINILQYGAGQTTLVAGAGVTIRSVSGALKLSTQYAAATLYKRGTDEWVAFGSLVT